MHAGRASYGWPSLHARRWSAALLMLGLRRGRWPNIIRQRTLSSVYWVVLRHNPSKRETLHSIFVYCWNSVVDGVPELKQHLGERLLFAGIIPGYQRSLATFITKTLKIIEIKETANPFFIIDLFVSLCYVQFGVCDIVVRKMWIASHSIAEKRNLYLTWIYRRRKKKTIFIWRQEKTQIDSPIQWTKRMYLKIQKECI